MSHRPSPTRERETRRRPVRRRSRDYHERRFAKPRNLSTTDGSDPTTQDNLTTVNDADPPTQDNHSTVDNADPATRHDLSTVNDANSSNHHDLSNREPTTSEMPGKSAESNPIESSPSDNVLAAIPFNEGQVTGAELSMNPYSQADEDQGRLTKGWT